MHGCVRINLYKKTVGLLFLLLTHLTKYTKSHTIRIFIFFHLVSISDEE